MINPRQFYIIGIGCFSVIALMSLIGWIAMFNNLPWYIHVQKFGSIIFNIALVGLFVFFLKQFSAPVKNKQITDDEMEKMLEEFK